MPPLAVLEFLLPALAVLVALLVVIVVLSRRSTISERPYEREGAPAAARPDEPDELEREDSVG
jgi:hypothetical protein